MRPPGKARRGSKPGVCDRRVTQPGEMQRRPNAEVFRDHCTSCVDVEQWLLSDRYTEAGDAPSCPTKLATARQTPGARSCP